MVSRPSPPLRLYTSRLSPSALKVRLALVELGLDFEQVEVDIARGEQHTDEFAAVNPRRKVPVLGEGDRVLRESNAILCTLGRERGGRLWPKAPDDVASALEWLFFESAHLIRPAVTVWWSQKAAERLGTEPPPTDVSERALAELGRSLDHLDWQLRGTRYLLGTRFSLVDCAVGVAVALLAGTSGSDRRRWPNVDAYRRRVQRRRSWNVTEARSVVEVGR